MRSSFGWWAALMHPVRSHSTARPPQPLGYEQTRASPAASRGPACTLRGGSAICQRCREFTDGSIGREHLAAVASVMTRTPERAATIAEAEPTFATATQLDPAQLAVVVRRWTHTVDPLNTEAAERALHAQRFLSCSRTFDGAVGARKGPVQGPCSSRIRRRAATASSSQAPNEEYAVAPSRSNDHMFHSTSPCGIRTSKLPLGLES